jgi:Holliday junction resolvase RusA-like endonuclease
MGNFKFKVDIEGLEPLSARVNRIHNKKALADRIVADSEDRIEAARKELGNAHVRVSVAFYLWEGGTGVPNTTSRKDLDNLLKLVFDSLQPYVDSQRTTPGAGLIGTDQNIFEVEATKEIVKEQSKMGLSLEITAL